MTYKIKKKMEKQTELTEEEVYLEEKRRRAGISRKEWAETHDIIRETRYIEVEMTRAIKRLKDCESVEEYNNILDDLQNRIQEYRDTVIELKARRLIDEKKR